ncbi:MAG: TadE/TadG family type IV pilus assembly protein [Acidimicrobiales bacterium]
MDGQTTGADGGPPGARATVAPDGAAGRRSERGAALVEFALVAPLLLILVFGIIEFGVAFHRSQAVAASAREAARLASLSTTTAAEIDARVDDSLAGLAFDQTPVVDVSPAGCAGRSGQSVTVTVTVNHNLTIPLLFETDVPLQGRAVFRCEA